MEFLRSIGALFVAWANSIAVGLVNGLDRLVSPKAVRLVEQPDGSFLLKSDGAGEAKDATIGYADGKLAAERIAAMLRGSRVELQLSPSHFLFRTIELPAQAADFLEGIVRAQIDRLTPWTAANAVFGCGTSAPLGSDRISTSIAVTTRPSAMSYVDAALAYQPASVAITTEGEEEGAGRITVFERKAQRFLNVPQITKALVVIMAVSAVLALLSFAVSTFLVGYYEEQRAEAAGQIARVQVAMRAGAETPDRAALQVLERRKHETPSATIVLEQLSRVLPDNTYVTELHITGDKMQVIGISRDTPSLIRLIEQSPNFRRATFFAPTTRQASDPGDRFHIEARLEPGMVVTQ